MTSRITVEGIAGGQTVFSQPLIHGLAPRRMLREASFKPLELLGYRMGAAGDITLSYTCQPLNAAHYRNATPRHAVAGAIKRQRVAAYAVVTSERGVLLTQLSRQTGRPGLWILPGGGVDDGENPRNGVMREAWEEAGQVIRDPQLVDVSTSHRVGPGREGTIEDFHAVRLIFRAYCDEPSEPVLHDVGGSTERAAWFDADAVCDPTSSGYPSGGMAPWSLDAVRAFLLHG